MVRASLRFHPSSSGRFAFYALRSSPRDGESCKPMALSARDEVRLEERRHGVVLAGSFLRASILAAAGVFAVAAGWPATVVGALLLAFAAAVALRAVWLWERTRVVLTADKLFVVHGTLRRRAAAVRLARIGAVEVEQSLTGRLLGYGTIVAGDLEITHVTDPRGLADRLST
jgi:membrane protein YdbS with pleckstrin-like domain